jgi:hypothetical protein
MTEERSFSMLQFIMDHCWNGLEKRDKAELLLGAYYSLHYNGLSLRAERSNPLRLPRLRAGMPGRRRQALR